jgi:hypothetical protein
LRRQRFGWAALLVSASACNEAPALFKIVYLFGAALFVVDCTALFSFCYLDTTGVAGPKLDFDRGRVVLRKFCEKFLDPYPTLC